MFLAPLILFQVVAGLLAFRFRSSVGDSEARLANAFYALFSRDPHLAAVGFVWNPLPSWLDMPLLLLKGWLPFLSRDYYAPFIVSSFAMAGCVVEVSRLLAEGGVRPAVRRTAAVLFALQPMIVYYGANGQSEALELYLLLVLARHLARWLRSGSTGSLVAAGLALAFVYLSRIEGAFAALGAGSVVLAVGFVRSRSRRTRARLFSAACDGAIFLAPFIFVFVGWAAVSWLIVGHPFEYISSQYGNSSQLRVSGVTSYFAGYQRYRLIVLAVLSLAPALPLVAPLAVWTVARGRSSKEAVVACMAVLGSILAFTIVGTAAGQTFGWYRIYITAIPLVVVLIAANAPGALSPRDTTSRSPSRKRSGPLLGAFGVLMSALLIGLSFPTTVWAIATPKIGREDHQHLGWVFDRQSKEPDRHKIQAVDSIARGIDSLGLKSGSILVDTFVPCVPYLYLTVRHPKVFLITNDRDFEPALSDPGSFHVSFMLVDDPHTGIGSLDELNRAYPTLFDGGLGSLAKDWPAAGTCPHLRLYRLPSPSVGQNPPTVRAQG